jgi:hypothetical protein
MVFCNLSDYNDGLILCVIIAFLVVAGLSCPPVEEACGKVPSITQPKGCGYQTKNGVVTHAGKAGIYSNRLLFSQE